MTGSTAVLLLGCLLYWTPTSGFSPLAVGARWASERPGGCSGGRGGLSPAGRPAGVRVWGAGGFRAMSGGGDQGDGLGGGDEGGGEKADGRPMMPFDKGASEFVPVDMQPANEWMNLKEEFLFDWPLMSVPDFAVRLGGVFAFFALFISLPIASDTYSKPDELGFRLLATTIGGLSVTLVLVLRFLAGYSFVADRLKAEAVYFETDERRPRSELGLQRLGYERRGEMWIKPQEIAKRDKLIWDYTVQPIEKRLQKSVLGLAGGIAVCLLAFNVMPEAERTAYDPRFTTSEARLSELLDPKMEAAANKEAQRLRERGNKPAYCYSRYYQARAGGEDVCRD